MLKQFSKRIQVFEIIVFLLILFIFTVLFSLFIDKKSNDKLVSFIYGYQKEELKKIAGYFDEVKIKYNILLDYASEMFFAEGQANLSSDEYIQENPLLIFDDKKNVVFNNSVGLNFPLIKTNDENIFITTLKYDTDNLIVYVLKKNDYFFLSYTYLDNILKPFHNGLNNYIIYNLLNNYIYTKEYFDFMKNLSGIIRSKHKYLVSENKGFLISNIKLEKDLYLISYTKRNTFLKNLQNSKKSTYTFTGITFGLTILIILLLLRYFLTRYYYEKEKYEKLFLLEQEKFQSIVEAIGEGVALIDINYNVLWFNNFVKKSLTNKFEGKCFEIFAGNNVPCNNCKFQQVVKDKKIQTMKYENYLENKTGHFEVILSPLIDEKGEVVAVVDLIRDITESVTMQNQLIKNETYLKNLIDYSPDAIVTLDYNFNIKTYNKQAKVLFSSIDLKGFNFKKIVPHNEFYEKLRKAVYIDYFDAITECEHFNNFPIRISASSFGEGKETEYILIIKDMKKIRELETQLIQSEKLSALGLLAGGVAHEINNPLVGILNFAQLLYKKLPESSNESKLVKTIIDAGNETKKIVQNLLTYARQNVDKNEDFFISESIDFSLRILNSKIKKKNIKVEKQGESDLKIKANKGKIHQVFVNLINNSIDACEQNGNIIITLIDENKYQMFKIYDNGVGIEKKIMDNIFDPFFTTKGVGEGTGLGLSIIAGIVKEHGWEISVKSELGKFTEFTVKINKIKTLHHSNH
jgi:signal transduction histidine kinase